MRIITTGARKVLIDRLQCMRDTLDQIDYNLWELMEHRADCCGYPISSSSSSESSSSSASESSSSSSSTPETFFILTENNDIEINEDNVTFPINENAP